MQGKPVPEDHPTAPRLSRRQQRADALRRRALSPVRILIMVLALPLSTALIAFGVYMRTTDYERVEAVVHLVALAGCDAAAALGFGPFLKGQPGYHERNDPDGDGVACGTVLATRERHPVKPQAQPTSTRSVGNAKFVRP